MPTGSVRGPHPNGRGETPARCGHGRPQDDRDDDPVQRRVRYRVGRAGGAATTSGGRPFGRRAPGRLGRGDGPRRRKVEPSPSSRDRVGRAGWEGHADGTHRRSRRDRLDEGVADTGGPGQSSAERRRWGKDFLLTRSRPRRPQIRRRARIHGFHARRRSSGRSSCSTWRSPPGLGSDAFGERRATVRGWGRATPAQREEVSRSPARNACGGRFFHGADVARQRAALTRAEPTRAGRASGARS
jgi:hypothetical protein